MADASSPATGEIELPPADVFALEQGGASTSSAERERGELRPSRALPIAAIAVAIAGSALALLAGWRTPPLALLGWALAGPVAVVLIVLARRIESWRASAARFVATRADERLLVAATIIAGLATIACCLVLGPWISRW